MTAVEGSRTPDHEPIEVTEMTLSTRDAEDLRRRLTGWLGQQLPAGAEPAVPDIGSNSANGMSSETVLFRADWTDADGTARRDELVARIAPDEANEPVFPAYELGTQFEVLRMVGELTDVPVPPVRWLERDASILGSPFFIMDRIDGEVPPDVMPYTFGDNWLYDAPKADQRRLQDTTVAVLAALHGITEPESRFSFLAPDVEGDTPLRRHVNHTREWYEFAVSRAKRSTLVDAGFAWLDAHWPDESPAVLSWGDSRVGNVMYRDFEPVAVLDWEMVGLGPRELDLGWLIFAHQVFEEIAGLMGLPGMPDFMRTDDVAATYEELTGYAPRDLEFYLVYAAVQWGVVFMRTGTRSAHFGEIEMPAEIEELMHHRPLFERLIAS
jgi:aminoglycoside phosphotransferase (APT) family kinase protein